MACVCAPHQSSGTGGTTPAASSFLTSRLPDLRPVAVGDDDVDAVGDQVGDAGHRHLGRRDLVLGPGPAVGGRHRVAAEGDEDSQGRGPLVMRRPYGRPAAPSNGETRPGWGE